MRILTGNSDSLCLRDNVCLLSVGEGRSIWAIGDVLWDDSGSPVLLLWDNSLGDWCWRIRWLVHNWSLVLITALWRGGWNVDSLDSLGGWCWWIRWLVHNWSLVLITTLWRGGWAVDSVDWLGDRAWAVIMTVRYDVRLKFKMGGELCLPVIVKVVASVTV